MKTSFLITRIVTIECRPQGAALADIDTPEGRYINAEMVADGAAWVYRKYSEDPELLNLERQAREEGRGLWALQEDQRVAPWEWRRVKRTK